jgi:hypothetical protein
LAAAALSAALELVDQEAPCALERPCMLRVQARGGVTALTLRALTESV